MGLKSIISRPFANHIAKKIQRWSSRPFATQSNVLQTLLNTAEHTIFGKEHALSSGMSYQDFKASVPVCDYEGLRPYIERIKKGEENVLWKGIPLYFAKTSGTTSGIKYIPISKESISNHIDSARNALLLYIAETGNSAFLNGKLIFLSGSPELEKAGNIPCGRLSGIVNHHVPRYLQSNRLPSYTTNCISDWEKKVDAIVKETISENMTLISGIPPWVQMYFTQLTAKTGKTIKEIFPDFSLFVHGGVNYEPYRPKIEKSIGAKIDTIETYPASEGFIAFQDSQEKEGLLLILNKGIFYEFIPADEYFSEHPTRVSLCDVRCGINYAIILNTNAGLWGYSIGDTVKFVSTEPHRLVVTGRISHYISAFGEHVIAGEVEKALSKAAEEACCEVVEFTVAPQINPEKGLPYHEWFVEFTEPPVNMEKFQLTVNTELQKQNIYYNDLLKGNILQPLKIRVMQKNAFIRYMKSQGKLGGQNKTPRLSNDRKTADELEKYVLR